MPELSRCKCCEFADYNKYVEYIATLDKLEKDFNDANTANDAIEDKIRELRDRLKVIQEYVLKNCDTPDNAFISDSFVYVSTELIRLATQVEAFKSILVPSAICEQRPPCAASTPTRNNKDCSCFCAVKCDAMAGQVLDKQICVCQNLENYQGLIDVKVSTQRMITELSSILVESSVLTQLISELTTLQTDIARANGQIQGSWARTTTETKIKVIEDLITRSKALQERSKSFMETIPCQSCVRPKVPKAVDCSCYTTQAITLFFRQFTIFSSIETRIKNFNFKGDSGKQSYFLNAAAQLRSEANAFIKKVTESVFDQASQSALLSPWSKKVDAFDLEWKAYSASQAASTTAAPVCTISCSGDNVKNCGTCTCDPVANWVELNTNIYNSIDATIAKIATLSTSAANKKTLTDNANYIKSKIDELRLYISDFCGALDIKYVRLLCLELSGFNNKLNGDITAIQDPKFISVCNVSCPNSKWVYDALACSCKCDVFNCAQATEVVDPYNCNCAQKSSCAKTQVDCDATKQLLDYANCICRDKKGQ